jgi:uncharacterized protein YjiS (DUF1127 family)
MSNVIAAKSSFVAPQVTRFGLTALAQLGRAAFWAVDRLVSHSRQRQAIVLLTAMDDRQLKDLGIVRSDIPGYVEGRFASYGRDES